MADLLTTDDLAPFATIDDDEAEAMVADAIARATLVAPCLAGDLTDLQVAQAKAILRDAVLRRHEAGSGATTQQTVGPFGQTVTPLARKSLFWPSEISDLRNICKSATSGGAFSLDTAAPPMHFRGVPFGGAVPLFDDEIALYGDYTDGFESGV
jgi:hypothetical protein